MTGTYKDVEWEYEEYANQFVAGKLKADSLRELKEKIDAFKKKEIKDNYNGLNVFFQDWSDRHPKQGTMTSFDKIRGDAWISHLNSKSGKKKRNQIDAGRIYDGNSETNKETVKELTSIHNEINRLKEVFKEKMSTLVRFDPDIHNIASRDGNN